jgi:septal ring factor EnvC (AmiA/AmiB activator)
MNDFPAPDTLNTLAAARDTYGKLLAAFHEKDGRIKQLEADLQAANELVDENGEAVSKLQDSLKAKAAELEQSRADTAKAKEATKAAEAKTTELEAKVAQLEATKRSAEEEAASSCASVGVDPLQIKPDNQSTQPDLMEQFQAIKDPGERTAFYRQHKDQLLSR